MRRIQPGRTPPCPLLPVSLLSVPAPTLAPRRPSVPIAGPPPGPPLSSAPPPVGSILRGTVHTIRPFGLFVALPGYRRHVMVHNTQAGRQQGGEGRVKRFAGRA